MISVSECLKGRIRVILVDNICGIRNKDETTASPSDCDITISDNIVDQICDEISSSEYGRDVYEDYDG